MYGKSKEEFDEIMKSDDKVRGVVLKTDAEYVRRHKGVEAVAKAFSQTNVSEKMLMRA